MRQMNSVCGAGQTLSWTSLEKDGTIASTSSSASGPSLAWGGCEAQHNLRV